MNNEHHGESRMKSPDRIRGRIPGFPGYTNPAHRVKADDTFRVHLEGLISGAIGQLEECVRSSATEKRLDLLSDFEDIVNVLEDLRSDLAAEVIRDPQKWASVTLSETQLARIQENDRELVDAVQAVHERIAAFSGPVPDRSEALLLKNSVDRLEGRFRVRCHDLEELGFVGEPHSG